MAKRWNSATTAVVVALVAACLSSATHGYPSFKAWEGAPPTDTYARLRDAVNRQEAGEDVDAGPGTPASLSGCVQSCATNAIEGLVSPCLICFAGLVADAMPTGTVGVNGITVSTALDLLRVVLEGLVGRSYTQAFCPTQEPGCTSRENFPGSDSRSVLSWNLVREQLAQQPRKEFSGEWWRGSELGIAFANPFFWSGRKFPIQPIAIGLGSTPSQHIVVRPVIEKAFMITDDNRAEIREKVRTGTRNFLRERRLAGSLNRDDLGAWTHQVLNIIAFDRVVSYEEALEFVELQRSLTRLFFLSQPLPPFAYQSGLDPINLPAVRDQIDDYVELYAPFVQEKYGELFEDADCSPSSSCLAQVTRAFFDALVTAGGASVPSYINAGLAVLTSADPSNPAPGTSYNRREAGQFAWEAIRYFAPVVGFPTWEVRPTCAGLTQEETLALNGTQACPLGPVDPVTDFPPVNQAVGGRRLLAVLAAAQRDPSVWGPDAEEFKLRPLELYSQSVGFAEPARDDSVAGGKMNRNCPAKKLALMMGTTFFELFDVSKWVQNGDQPRFQGGSPYVGDVNLTRAEAEDETWPKPSGTTSPNGYRYYPEW